MPTTQFVQHFVNTLKLVRKHLGHSKVPAQFRIPATHEFPIELHGAAFGKSVSNIRSTYKKNQLSKEQIDLMEKENMIWDVPEHNFQLNLKCLRLYKQIYGDLFIPHNFIVPRTKDWPEEFWGIRLGTIITSLQSRKENLKTHRLEQLSRMGFIWQYRHLRFNMFYIPALQWYKQQFNHANVPSRYVIPADNDLIPKEIQGVRLGKFLSRISTEGQPLVETQRKQLHDIGYDLNSNMKSHYNQIILQLQEHYKQHGSLSMKHGYRVNGYPLGEIFSGLVLGNTFHKFYGAKVMEAMGLYRDITDTMFDQIVVAELDQYREQKPNHRICFNSVLPNGMVQLGYLKYHCKHPKLVAYLRKYNL